MTVGLREESFWVHGNDRALFVCRHNAVNPGAVRRVFVVCPAFAEEKNKSQRLLVELARGLARSGVDVFRLDYSGTGDSEGRFQEATLAGQKEDIETVIAYARQDMGGAQFGLLGLRQGSVLAAAVSEEVDGIDWLVHVAPVFDLRRWLRHTVRSKLVKGMLTAGSTSGAKREVGEAAGRKTLDLDGFPLTAEMHSEINAFRLFDGERRFRGRVLILHASLNPKMTADCESYLSAYDDAGLDVSFKAVQVEPFWNIHGVPRFDKIVDTVQMWLIPRMKKGGARGAGANEFGTANVRRLDRVALGHRLEEVLTLDGPTGVLSGIIHIPCDWDEPERKRVAVIFLHGWAGYRMGPHRMLVTAARRFCEAGYLCVRVDARGRGASNGQSGETTIESMKEDARHAVRGIRRRFAPDKVVVLGQCKGGSAGFLLNEMEGCVVWSAPPVDVGVKANLRRSHFMIKEYARKLFLKETWAKTVRGRLNYRLIREALVGHFHRDDESGLTRLASQSGTKKSAPSGRPCLFVYGENDPDTVSAQATFETLCEKAGHAPTFHVVPGANHSFYSIAWEKEVLDETQAWLDRHFPSGAGTGVESGASRELLHIAED